MTENNIKQLIRGEKYRVTECISAKVWDDGACLKNVSVPKGIVFTIVKFDYYTKKVIVSWTGATLALDYDLFKLEQLVKCEDSTVHPSVIDTIVMLTDKRPLFAFTPECILAVSVSINVFVFIALFLRSMLR